MASTPGLTALAASRRQRIGALVATGSLAVALFFELVASVALSGAGTAWTRSEFRLWSWGFDYGSGALIHYRHAPLLVFVGLIAGTVALSTSIVGSGDAFRRASGRKLMWRWSGREEKRRLRAELRSIGSAGLLRRRVRPLLLTGFLAAALVAILGAIGPQSTATVELATGLGPRLCLAASLVALAGILLAWPWSAPRLVSVGSDGSIGLEAPTASAETPPLLAAAAATAPVGGSEPLSLGQTVEVAPTASADRPWVPQPPAAAPTPATATPSSVSVAVLESTGAPGREPVTEPDVVDQLERLTALFRSGALTEAQFEAAKERLLARGAE